MPQSEVTRAICLEDTSSPCCGVQLYGRVHLRGPSRGLLLRQKLRAPLLGHRQPLEPGGVRSGLRRTRVSSHVLDVLTRVYVLTRANTC